MAAETRVAKQDVEVAVPTGVHVVISAERPGQNRRVVPIDRPVAQEAVLVLLWPPRVVHVAEVDYVAFASGLGVVEHVPHLVPYLDRASKTGAPVADHDHASVRRQRRGWRRLVWERRTALQQRDPFGDFGRVDSRYVAAAG